MDLNESPLTVSKDNTPKLKLHADISKTWGMENKIETYSSLHAPGSVAQLMADQFRTAFTLDGVE